MAVSPPSTADTSTPWTAVCAGGCGGAALLWLLAGRGRGDPAQTAVHGVLVSAVLGGLTAMV
ncbi:hypothetical protein B5181_31195, partial [Streptomyces sp. 4F]